LDKKKNPRKGKVLQRKTVQSPVNKTKKADGRTVYGGRGKKGSTERRRTQKKTRGRGNLFIRQLLALGTGGKKG